MKIDTETDEYMDILRQGAPTSEGKLVQKNDSSTAVTLHTEEDPDIEYARDSIRAALEIGLDSLQSVNELAKSTDDPRAFRVVPALLAAIADSAEALIKSKSQPKPSGQEQAQQPSAGNPSVAFYFEGTPAEIQRKKRTRTNIIDNGEFEEQE